MDITSGDLKTINIIVRESALAELKESYTAQEFTQLIINILEDSKVEHDLDPTEDVYDYITVDEEKFRTKSKSFFLIETPCGEKILTVMSAAEEGGRNTFLGQPIAPILKRVHPYKDSTSEDEQYTKLVCVIRPLLNRDSTYIRYVIRLLKTFNVRIFGKPEDTDYLNSIAPYICIDDIINEKELLRLGSRQNSPSYLTKSRDNVAVIAKLTGAQQGESLMLLAALTVLLKEEYGSPVAHFFPAPETSNHKKAPTLSEDLKKVIGICNFILKDEAVTIPPTKGKMKQGSSRNQNQYRKNLYEKYGTSDCLLCGEDQYPQASHLHRVTDIDNDFSLTPSEKEEQATSGENGIFACPRCDSYIENGDIYFSSTGKIMINHTDETRIAKIKELLINESIPAELFTSDMQKYADLHKKRIEKQRGLAPT